MRRRLRNKPIILGRQLFTLLGIALVLLQLLVGCSLAEFEQRDKRFYYRALWNFALRENLKELDIEFNGVDFGHSTLYETLNLGQPGARCTSLTGEA